MPSSNKTAHLALNNWSGADKPKMADFNGDNQKIDTGVKTLSDSLDAHLISTLVHLTTSDKDRISRVMTLHTSTYTGNGTASRKITLGYKARFGIVFPVGRPMFEANSADASIRQMSAIFTEIGCPEGIAIESDGLTVSYSQYSRPDGNTPRLNEPNVTYAVITLR